MHITAIYFYLASMDKKYIKDVYQILKKNYLVDKRSKEKKVTKKSKAIPGKQQVQYDIYEF